MTCSVRNNASMLRIVRPPVSAENTAWQLDQFTCNTDYYDILEGVYKDITSSRCTKTRVKLSRKGWRDRGGGFFLRKLPKISVPLDDVENLVFDRRFQNVLLCVFAPQITDNYLYMVVAYKFREPADVRSFVDLFASLRGEIGENTSDDEFAGEFRPGCRPISRFDSNQTGVNSWHNVANSCIWTTSCREPEDAEDARSFDHAFDDAFERKTAVLSRKIYLDEELLNSLRDKEVLTARQIDDIKNYGATDGVKCSRMLELLRKRPDSCYALFLEALRETKQEHIIQHLNVPRRDLTPATRRRFPVSVMHSDPLPRRANARRSHAPTDVSDSSGWTTGWACASNQKLTSMGSLKTDWDHPASTARRHKSCLRKNSSSTKRHS